MVYRPVPKRNQRDAQGYQIHYGKRKQDYQLYGPDINSEQQRDQRQNLQSINLCGYYYPNGLFPLPEAQNGSYGSII